MAGKGLPRQVMQFWEYIGKSGKFDSFLSKIQPIAVSNGMCLCKMKVEKEHVNAYDTLHGGMTAAIVDSISTVALVSTEPHKPGVSVDLSVSYLRAAPIGEEITIEAKTIKTGKSLSFLTVDLTDSKGRLLAQGKHTKFVGGDR